QRRTRHETDDKGESEVVVAKKSQVEERRARTALTFRHDQKGSRYEADHYPHPVFVEPVPATSLREEPCRAEQRERERCQTGQVERAAVERGQAGWCRHQHEAESRKRERQDQEQDPRPVMRIDQPSLKYRCER